MLIVEDDAPLRKGMVTLLRMGGSTNVEAAGTIADALKLVDSAAPSHVILDMNLPDGLGTEVLRHIRSQGMQTRVMVLSGSADLTMLDEARRLGVDEVVTKPPDWDRIIQWASHP